MAKLAHFAGVRGLCMIPIYLHHYWIDFSYDLPRPRSFVQDWKTIWLLNGPLCVGIFFALSGRLLPGSLYHKKDAAAANRWLADAMLRRPFRLLLPLLLILYAFRILAATGILIATRERYEVVIEPYLNRHPWDTNLYEYHNWGASWLKPLKDTYSLLSFNHQPHYIILWTIPYQIWMSYAVFSLAWVSNHYRRFAKVFLPCLPVLAHWCGMGEVVGFFPLGVAFAHFTNTRPSEASPLPGVAPTQTSPRKKALWVVLPWIALAIGCGPLFGYLDALEKHRISQWLERRLHSSDYLMRLVGVSGILFWIEHSPAAHRLLSHRFLTWFGGVSFQFYLTARVTTYLVATWVIAWRLGPLAPLAAPGWTERQFLATVWGLALPLSFAASLVVAHFCTTLIDTPCANLIQKGMANLRYLEEASAEEVKQSLVTNLAVIPCQFPRHIYRTAKARILREPTPYAYAPLETEK